MGWRRATGHPRQRQLRPARACTGLVCGGFAQEQKRRSSRSCLPGQDRASLRRVTLPSVHALAAQRPEHLCDALQDAVCGTPELFSYWRADEIWLKLVRQRKQMRSIQAALARRAAATEKAGARTERAMAGLSAVPARWGSASRPKATGKTQKPNAARAWSGTWLVGQGSSPAAFVSSPARTRSSPEKQLMLSSASSPNRNNPSDLRHRLRGPTGVMLQANAGKTNTRPKRRVQEMLWLSALPDHAQVPREEI